MHDNFTILKHRLWSVQRSQSTLDFSEAEPRFWIAARYTEMVWVYQETLLKANLLEKDHPQLSSKIQGTWHHLLTDWNLILQEILWYRSVK